MADPERLVLTVRIENPKAIKALGVVGESLESLAEDFGYREDVRRALKAFRYVRKNLTYKVVDKGEP